MQESASYQSLPQRSRRKRRHETEVEGTCASDGSGPETSAANTDGQKTSAAEEGVEHREQQNSIKSSCIDESSELQQTGQAHPAPNSSAAPVYRTAAEGSHCFECA